MKYAVSLYSYSQLKNKGKSTEELLELAKKQGFDGVEFLDIEAENGKSSEERAAELKAKCDELGLEVACYTVFADFLKGSDGNFEKEIERLKKQVDIAGILGVKKMRHDATGGYADGKRGFRGFDDALPVLAEGCRTVTRYAAEKGIKTMVENHGYFSQDSERVEKLVNAVADDNFGLLVDIGNFACVDEDSVTAVGRVAPYAFHVHCKDFYIRKGNAHFYADGFFTSRGGNHLRGSIIGHGDIDVYQCIHTLLRNGYDDYFTVEFEGMEDCETGVKYGLNTLKSIVADF